MKQPTVTFESVTFSDGTTIELEETDVVVFVGPNNAGKSLALKELEEHFGDPVKTTVVKAASTRKLGTKEDFAKYIRSHTKVTPQGSSWNYSFLEQSLSSSQEAEQIWPDQVNFFRPLFCKRIPTETRILDSSPVSAINLLDESPKHPIHLLYADDELEARISNYFRKAFGEDLNVYISAGSHWPLFVGERPEIGPGEQRHSLSFSARFRSQMVPLEDQGDGMRSFASVILHLLAPVTRSILLLDEPEAFLHPPQARLLGEMIVREKSPRAQLFLATHSPDVLQGLINVVPEHLHVLRIQRDGQVNRVRELDKVLVREMGVDPLMRYSGVLSGLFHERVIICEGDADCMFYSSVLDLPEVHGEKHPDVLFVHGGGNDRLSKLAKTLVSLDVPVDIIADLDVLKDLGLLQRIIEALDGDWDMIKPLACSVKKSIEASRPRLSYEEIKNSVLKELDQDSPADDAMDLKMRISKVFQLSSPWNAVKQAGQAALPQGQTTQQFQKLQRLCSQMGLWIVPEGELEGFCRSIGGHGPRWVQQVLEKPDFGVASELESARKFMRDIWEAKRREAT